MSILESMRSESDSGFMQFIFAAVVVAFVATSYGGSNERTSTVVEINGEPVSSIEYSRAYRNAEYNEERRLQQPLSDAQKEGLKNRVIDNIIARKALLQEARRMGLVVTSYEMQMELLKIPAFLDNDGNFDDIQFNNYLRSQRQTRGDFEMRMYDDLLLQKLTELIALGTNISKPTVREDYIENNTKLSLDLVRIDPVAFYGSFNPTPAEVEAWLADEANAAAVKAEYDDRLGTEFDKPEKVDVTLIRRDVKTDGLTATELKKEMEALRAEIEAGASFDDKVLELSDDPSKIRGGKLEGVDIISLPETVQTALVDVEEGAMTTVVASSRDIRLYRLDKRIPARIIPLEEVRLSLAEDMMKAEQAPKRAGEAAEAIQAAWAAEGVVPTELLDTYGLSVSGTGLMSPTGAGALGPKPPIEMLKAARSGDVGVVLGEVFQSGSTLWVGSLTDRVEADMTSFEEEYDRFYEQALLRARQDFANAWQQDVIDRADVKR